MAATIARLSKKELSRMIQQAVENALDQKMVEMFGDPDQGLKLRASVVAQLRRQKRAVAKGERGRRMEDVFGEIDLE